MLDDIVYAMVKTLVVGVVLSAKVVCKALCSAIEEWERFRTRPKK